MEPQQVCCRCNAAYAADPLEERFGGVCPHCLVTFAFSGRGAGAAGDTEWPSLPGLELLELLGRGGMGVVYRAYQPELDREVAVKLVRADRSDREGFDERFRREARSQASLDHPGIARVLEFGVTDDDAYLVMELVDGPSLRTVLQGGPLPPALALDLARQLADILEYAHAQGVVHRDVKPENLLLDDGNRLRVVDFGLARQLEGGAWSRLTAPGQQVGTPLYMAPEQIAGEAVDSRADLYALGVVLYEMLTGDLPMGRYQNPSDSSDVGQWVDDVVSQALERNPAARQQAAAEIRDQLQTALDNVDSYVPHTAEPTTSWRFKFCVLVVLSLGLSLCVYDVAQIFAVADLIPRLMDVGAELPQPTVLAINIASLLKSFWFILVPIALMWCLALLMTTLMGHRFIPWFGATMMLMAGLAGLGVTSMGLAGADVHLHLQGDSTWAARTMIPDRAVHLQHLQDYEWTEGRDQVHRRWLVIEIASDATVGHVNEILDTYEMTIVGGDPKTGRMTVALGEEYMLERALEQLRGNRTITSRQRVRRPPPEDR